MGMKKRKTITYYDILGVGGGASDEQIRHAYRMLARKWHPDMKPKNRKKAAENFNRVHMAYAHLRTKPQRAAYDRFLAKHSVTAMRPINDNRHPHGVVRFLTNIKEIFWPIAPKQEIERHG